MDTEFTLELAMAEAHQQEVEQAKERFVSRVREYMGEVKRASRDLASAKKRLAEMKFVAPEFNQ